MLLRETTPNLAEPLRFESLSSVREQAAEAFAIMNLVKNIFAFGLTFYC